MAEIIATFFSLIGSDIIPPTTMQELIPYLFTMIIGIVLVALVFKIIATLTSTVLGLRRF